LRLVWADQKEDLYLVLIEMEVGVDQPYWQNDSMIFLIRAFD